jgi:RNA polymerase sigma factor (sigma-70 family)
MNEQDRQIAETIARERGRLRNFIRKRLVDREDVEDVLQDVFFELVEAYRLMKPIEQVGAWLFRVARNRIIDRFRRKRTDSLSESHRFRITRKTVKPFRSKTCCPRWMPDRRRHTPVKGLRSRCGVTESPEPEPKP